jgi:hypothetical protein
MSAKCEDFVSFTSLMNHHHNGETNFVNRVAIALPLPDRLRDVTGHNYHFFSPR